MVRQRLADADDDADDDDDDDDDVDDETFNGPMVSSFIDH